MWRYLVFLVDVLAALMIGFVFIGAVILTDLNIAPGLLKLKEYGTLSELFVFSFLGSGMWMLFRWMFSMMDLDYNHNLLGWTQNAGMGTVNFTGIFAHGVDHHWPHWITFPLAAFGIICTVGLVMTYTLLMTTKLPHPADAFRIFRRKCEA
jgi:hypothetical protein